MTIVLIISLDISAEVAELGYQILERQPQTLDNFVQGLEIFQEKVYLSSGGYGKSMLRRYDLRTGILELEHPIESKIFAEGLTIFKDELYLLSWRAKQVMIFDPRNFTRLSTFKISGEGWGITHNKTHLIYSDGSHRLRFFNPGSRRIERELSIQKGKRRVQNLNELEYIDNKIWANIWLSNRIIIIDPESGQVIAFLDFTDLAEEISTNSSADVLNGIALDSNKKHIWITGKRWPWRFKIEISPSSTTDIKMR